MDIGYPPLSVTNNANTHAVRHLQTLLNAHGANLYIDGRFATGTSRALAAFQIDNKLEPLGYVCEDTWELLSKSPSKASKSSSTASKKKSASGGTAKKKPAAKKASTPAKKSSPKK